MSRFDRSKTLPPIARTGLRPGFRPAASHRPTRASESSHRGWSATTETTPFNLDFDPPLPSD